jgi:GNAT superfamily N-acetyltransferase
MANNLRYEVFDITNPRHVDAALQAKQWQDEEKPRMLPLGPEEMANHIYGIMAFDAGTDDFVGYNAAMCEYEGGILEIGGLFVGPEFRGRGIAREIKLEILARMREYYPSKKLLTFVNENSEHVNRELGFVDGSIETVPTEALEVCSRCPAFKNLELGRLCCDKVLIYQPEA